MKPVRAGLALAVAAAGLAAAPLTVAHSAPDPQSLTQKMTNEARGEVKFSREDATGDVGFVRTRGSGDLLPSKAADNATTAAAKAQAYLAKYAGSFGARATELKQAGVEHTRYGWTVTYHQQYQGLPVFGGELKANLDSQGRLRAVNGFTAPDLALSTTVRRTAAEASARAVALVKAKPPTGLDERPGDTSNLTASKVTKVVYRIGSTRGAAGKNIVAYTAEVSNGSSIREFVVLDANSLKAVNRWSLVNDALDRELRMHDADTGADTTVWQEGDAFPGTLAQDSQDILSSSAETYALFKNTFGRDSFDGKGGRMIALQNSKEGCPNASWNGEFTQYCDGVEDDDTVAHEWGHAYTQYTAGLVYQWQSGALNESYSDVWGETVDLLNNREDAGENLDVRTSTKCSVHSPAQPLLSINSPAAIAKDCATGGASFGKPLTGDGITADVVLAEDAVEDGGTASDGCSDYTNDVTGKIVLVDRGLCAFEEKAQRATAEGAAALIIGNRDDSVIGMSGSDTSLVTTVSIGLTDRESIRSSLRAGQNVNVTLKDASGDRVDSHRWLLSEKSTAFGGAIRDMWNPTCHGDPGKVTDAEYKCSPDDHGGVHGNSGVPNHAYALLVDGGTYNGVTSKGLGLDKAAAIYFRSLSQYLTPTSDFTDQADALEASCADLQGQPINKLSLEPGATAVNAPSITADDCAQVAAVNKAVEFRTSPAATCEWTPMFEPGSPSACGKGFSTVDVWGEDFEDGLNGWTSSQEIVYDQGIGQPWTASRQAPGNHPGGVAYGPTPDQGACGGIGDFSSVDWITSPAVALPSEGASPRLSFDHYVATEGGYDGGVVQMKVNSGKFTTIPASAYVFNAPVEEGLAAGVAAGGDNTNPLGGMDGFTGTDPGAAHGTWGTSIIDLSKAGVPTTGTVQFRFGIGRDGCGGIDGWYVDNVKLQVCEVTSLVTASIAPARVNLGKPVTLTATVKAASGLHPRGTVQVTNAAGKVVGTATTASGAPLTFAIPGSETAKAGKATFTVSYLGNGRYAPGRVTASVTVVGPTPPKPVTPAASVTTVKVNPAKPRKGKPFTVIATVRSAKPVTGTVKVYVKGTLVGRGTVNAGTVKVRVKAGVAKRFKVGSVKAKAVYSGSATVKASTGTKKFTIRR